MVQSSQTIDNSSRRSFENSGRNMPQQMVPATHITSIEEEDNEMDYGSQVVASDNTGRDPREMTSSSVVQ